MSRARRLLVVLLSVLSAASLAGSARAAGCSHLRVPTAITTFDDEAGLPISAGEDGTTTAVWLEREPSGATVRASGCSSREPWSAPRAVASSPRPLRLVQLRALRVTSKVAALLWEESSVGELPARLHLAALGDDGRWSDRVLDVLPAGWHVEEADLAVLSDGRPLAVWHAAVADYPRVPGIVWSAVTDSSGSMVRSAISRRLDGLRTRPVDELHLLADQGGGAWLVSTGGAYDERTLSWSRLLPQTGWQVGLGLDDASGPELWFTGLLGPVALGPKGDPNVVMNAGLVTIGATGELVESPRIPYVRGRDGVTKWISAGGPPSPASLVTDRRGRPVIGAAVPVQDPTIGVSIVGWTATTAPWVFRGTAAGRWRTELVDPLAGGGPSGIAAQLRSDGRGRLRAFWALRSAHGRRCQTLVMTAREASSVASWTPRTLVGAVRGPRCVQSPIASTGGRAPVVAIGGRGLTTFPAPRSIPRRTANATSSLATGAWADVRRGGAVGVRCSAARGAICSVEVRPVLPSRAVAASWEPAEVGECLDGRFARTVGRSEEVVVRIPIDNCPRAELERVRQLDLHVIVDQPGRRPLALVERVAVRP